MNANTKFGVKEVMDVILYDMESNAPVIFFDTLKTSNLEVTSEKVYARGGRGNAKLITWELNKEAKLTIEDALLSPKSLDLVSGGSAAVGSKSIYMRQSTEYDTTGDKTTDLGTPLKIDASNKVKLAYLPKEEAGKILVYAANDDCGTAIPVSGIDPDTKTITLGSGAVGENVIVYYTFESNKSEQYTIDASTFSGTYKMVGNTVIRNTETGKDEAFQIVIPNLKWSSALTLNLSAEGDPQPTSFECEVMKAPDSDTMIQMTRWE